MVDRASAFLLAHGLVSPGDKFVALFGAPLLAIVMQDPIVAVGAFLVMAMDGYIVFHHVAPRRSCDDATVELLCDLFLGSSRGRMKSPAFSGRSRSRS